jgi:hypothetical protein
MVGGSGKEKDGVSMLPEVFNDGDEGGDRPAFPRSPAARVNGYIVFV